MLQRILQEILQELEDEVTEYGMKISVDNTKVLIINDEEDNNRNIKQTNRPNTLIPNTALPVCSKI